MHSITKMVDNIAQYVLSLPEIKFAWIRYLGVHDIASLFFTCKSIKSSMTDHQLWYNIAIERIELASGKPRSDIQNILRNMISLQMKESEYVGCFMKQSQNSMALKHRLWLAVMKNQNLKFKVMLTFFLDTCFLNDSTDFIRNQSVMSNILQPTSSLNGMCPCKRIMIYYNGELQYCSTSFIAESSIDIGHEANIIKEIEDVHPTVLDIHYSFVENTINLPYPLDLKVPQPRLESTHEVYKQVAALVCTCKKCGEFFVMKEFIRRIHDILSIQEWPYCSIKCIQDAIRDKELEIPCGFCGEKLPNNRSRYIPLYDQIESLLTVRPEKQRRRRRIKVYGVHLALVSLNNNKQVDDITHFCDYNCLYGKIFDSCK